MFLTILTPVLISYLGENGERSVPFECTYFLDWLEVGEEPLFCVKEFRSDLIGS